MIENISMKSIHSLFSLSGKTAVITNGGKGIGLATAKRLSELGAHVFLADKDLETAEKRSRELNQRGLKATAIKLDISNEDHTIRVTEIATKETSSLDIWCNLSENTLNTPLEKLNINLMDTYIGSRIAIAKMPVGNFRCSC
ncbi:SDR family NAD(P)-dependent oxidoreductase [Chryseobacterium sp. CCH4-E10]|uniref:SDR family NAD(P)-dependent oxidoreductase n=1 Tax=Chryseobacterium sp. CCH4-E10 TaxID=1768758 RepID=UPI0008328940|nr:SDR family NAD(P)-dependent oxidoreductase [Chryseobacterium sp. CCH4-E10]